MSYLELYERLMKPWASVNDIRVIVQCGRDNAMKIRNDIQKQIIKEGKKIPYGKTKVVPTKMVLEYCDIDIDYIFKMAKNEKALMEVKC